MTEKDRVCAGEGSPARSPAPDLLLDFFMSVCCNVPHTYDSAFIYHTHTHTHYHTPHRHFVCVCVGWRKKVTVLNFWFIPPAAEIEVCVDFD